jgi:hypothetical protein
VAVRKFIATFMWGLLGLVALAPRAQAHALSTSYLFVEEQEQGSQPVRWDLSLHDLIWTVFIDADFDGLATWQEVQDARPAITAAVLAQLAMKRGGEPCALRVNDFALADHAEQHYLSVALLADCPRVGPLNIGGPLFLTGDASQRVLLRVTRGQETLTGVLSPGSPVWDEPARQSAWSSFVRFVGEGIWHVIIGYDHIAFVLLLLLPSVLRPVDGQWRGASGPGAVTRDIVTIITAFTIAHSITLALAVTKTVVLPSKPIEIAIAASIAVAGAFNLVPRLSGWRLPLAFGFGFVHGFGFANALSEIDAGGVSLLPLLGGFNIGVEVAQLGIVAIVLPLIYVARGRKWYAGGVLPLGSCALGVAGLVWLVQRL